MELATLHEPFPSVMGLGCDDLQSCKELWPVKHAKIGFFSGSCALPRLINITVTTSKYSVLLSGRKKKSRYCSRLLSTSVFV